MTAARATVPRWRDARRSLLPWLLLGLVAAVWAGFWRPTALGGSASYVVVAGDSMRPTLHPDDLVVLRAHDTYEIGDVVAFRVPDGRPGDDLQVIHRIVAGSAAEGYVTRGDNRNVDDPWRPRPDDILGSEAIRVPRAGLAIGVLTAPVVVAAVVVLVIVWLVLSARAARVGPGSAPGTAAAQVAARIRSRYVEEADPAVRRGIRLVAFELAMAYGTADPTFDKNRFLDDCGIGTEP